MSHSGATLDVGAKEEGEVESNKYTTYYVVKEETDADCAEKQLEGVDGCGDVEMEVGENRLGFAEDVTPIDGDTGVTPTLLITINAHGYTSYQFTTTPCAHYDLATDGLQATHQTPVANGNAGFSPKSNDSDNGDDIFDEDEDVPETENYDVDVMGDDVGNEENNVEDAGVSQGKKKKRKRVLQCNDCSYVATRSSDLSRHRRRKHAKDASKLHQCDSCPYAAVRKCDLTQHKRTHTGERPYKCELCDFATTTSSQFVRHKRRHTGETPVVCNGSASSSRNTDDLDDDNDDGEDVLVTEDLIADKEDNVEDTDVSTGKKKEVKRLLQCNNCSYVASRSSDLLRHKRHKHAKDASKLHQCDSCPYAAVRKCDLMQHKRTHTGERPYQCQDCDFSGISSSTLLQHRKRKHTEQKTLSCESCDYSTVDPTSLLRHAQRQHTKENLHKCDQCDFATVTAGELKVHKRRHENLKPFTCDLCSYSAVKSSDIKRHMLKHTGEKVHKCDQCDYATSRHSSLTQHKRTHTGERPYKCELCDFATTTSSQFVCDQCDYRTGDSGCMMGHRRKHARDSLRRPSRVGMVSCVESGDDEGNVEGKEGSGVDREICGDGKEDSGEGKKGTGSGVDNNGSQDSAAGLFKCSLCSFIAVKGSDLTIHTRTHSGERPYMCDQCGYCAARQGTLTRYRQTTLSSTVLNIITSEKCEFATTSKSFSEAYQEEISWHRNVQC